MFSQTPHITVPLHSEHSLLFTAQTISFPLTQLALFVFTNLLVSVVILTTMFLWEHYKKFQLQKVLLSRKFYNNSSLSDMCSPHVVQCSIMLDYHYKFDCCQCPNGHWVEKSALQRHIEFETQKPLSVTGGHIKCPSCPHQYSAQTLAFFCEPQAYEAYQKMRKTQLEKQVKAKILADIEEKKQKKARDADRKLAQEAIRNQFTSGNGEFYGFMCPTCGFGPVDHMECDDLTAHHGEFKDYGVEIDNACPMCFWYGSEKTEWGLWNGEFLEGEQLEATQKAVDEFKLPYEKFKEGALARLKEIKGQIAEAQVCTRLAMLQQIAPQEYPETLADSSYLDKVEDPQDISFRMQMTYSSFERQHLTSHLIQTLNAYKKKDFATKYKPKELKKEQTELVTALKEKRKDMAEKIQKAVKALGYEIEVEHPEPEDDDF